MEKKDKKKEGIVIPNFTLLLALIFFLIGAYPAFSYRNTVKKCTSETKGVVVSESRRYRSTDRTVKNKYALGKYQSCVEVETDGCFKHEQLYVSGIGETGKEVIIRYDPNDPDEYYFADYYSNGRAFATLTMGISGSMIILSLIFFIYYNLPLVFPKKNRE